MKQLSKICKNVEIFEYSGSPDIQINELEFDSRNISDGDLYIALKGSLNDGHIYIEEAVSKGASAVLCEEFPAQMNSHCCYLKVRDTRETLGIMASEYYGNPSEELKVVGITGTNGKTTIATILYNLFQKLGYKSGLISTVCYIINENKYPSTHTTPDPVKLNKLMSEMIMAGCEYCFIEVSSHAIDQKRIAGMNFTGGVFSNITRDHLDYHKNFPDYLKVKKLFFDNLPQKAFALVNYDDKNSEVILQNTKAWKRRYSIRSIADFKGKVLESAFNSTQLEIDGTEIWTSLIGDFNASNLTAVYGCAILLEQEKYEILKALSGIKSVRGRCEYIKLNNSVTAIIDYAHTPDALKNILDTINKIKKGKEKLITVVGAGGDRDKGKRPKMGNIAARLSNRLILTSDNPRWEDPDQIILDMYNGIDNDDINKVIKVNDRKEAIKTAIIMAEDGDIILVAGKGHENYQEIKGINKHFDDLEMLLQLGRKTCDINE